MSKNASDWVQGRMSLAAAAGWRPEEMRLVAEIGFALAEQGREEEATAIFDGLAALAPATAYFQAALGALWLRRGDTARAVSHLDKALALDPADAASLVNRGEARLNAGALAAARADFHAALRLESVAVAAKPSTAAIFVRARALLTRLESLGDIVIGGGTSAPLALPPRS